MEIAPAPETTGSNLLVQHQKLIMEHFGHKKTAVLPEDIIQRLLLGFSRFWLPFPPLHLEVTPLMVTPYAHSTHNILYFQLTHTLELALHLESKVIQLKQDALRLINVALAGTACGQLLTLFEFAFGYPKRQEYREQNNWKSWRGILRPRRNRLMRGTLSPKLKMNKRQQSNLLPHHRSQNPKNGSSASAVMN